MSWLRLLLLLIAATMTRLGMADESVTVRLASGRAFTGQIDPRTSYDRLWLRTVKESISVLRPIDWHRVDVVATGTVEMTGATLRAEYDRYTVPPPNRFVPGHGAWGGTSAAQSTGRVQWHSRSSTTTEPVRQAVTLKVAAEIANWDADVESDGIVVDLQPLDEAGRPAPSSGSLRIDLWAYDPRAASDRSFRVAASTTPWLTAEDFADGHAVVRLPFAASHPDFDTRLGHVALVHARWAPPGGQVLDASIDARIREYSAVRDRLEQEQGVRFFRGERTGRSD